MRTKIEITAADIRKATKLVKTMARAKTCPIALALLRQFPQRDIRVRTEEIYGLGKPIRMPKKACDFIYDFDCDRPVKPFSFILHMVE